MPFTTWPYPDLPTDPVTSFGIDGTRFLINGKRQHLRGFTDFAGLNVFIRTGQVSPLALQMQELHQKFVSLSTPVLSPRILLMKNKGSHFDLDPRELPDYFTKLRQHAEIMQQKKFCPIYVLLADCRDFGMDINYQRDFVAKACDVLRYFPFPVELVNEYNSGPQSVDPMAFDKPPGVVISRGSPGEAGLIPWPGWDWHATRLRRDHKWRQTIGDSGYSYRAGEWGGPPVPVMQPIFDTEPRGFASDGDPRRLVSPDDSFALALESALWFHAAVLHLERGIRSELLDQGMINCAITFLRGMYAATELQVP